jgi:diguanylate cyclase (GGDEF)-like protein/PAS domain S-box-containing protein
MKADILLVVSHTNEVRLLSSFLRQQGYGVRVALDGEMGLIATETKSPDLILADTRLPYLDGYQMGQKLRENTTTAEIPLIFLLSAENSSARLSAFQSGANDYLLKPYNLEELRLKMGYQLDYQREKAQLRLEIDQLQQKLQLTNIDIPDQETPEYLNLLRSAIATINNGIVITDATGDDYPIVYVNAGFEKMTGYSFEEVVGKNCRFLQGEDRDQEALGEIRQALQLKKQCCVTLRNYRRDGRLFWNEISLSPICDPEGQVVYYIAIQTDVTDRKRAEEELQRSQAAMGQMNRELYRLNDRLNRLANLDGLTEVANRRCFDERLQQEWQRLTREKQPISLILGDIDYFKRYNDTYGHLDGDDCLRSVARAMSGCIHRSADLVARCGGEEFAVILPNTPLEGVLRVAENVRAAIEALQIPHQASDANNYVTMSLGVATIIPTPKQEAKELIATADRALFRAKALGRNRVVSEEMVE